MTDLSENCEKPQVNRARRSLALSIFGALGGVALLEGCASPQDAAPDSPEDGDRLRSAEASLSGTSSVRWFDTAADLASAAGAANREVGLLLGYHVPGDGGGGVFYWDASSTAANNGGTVFAASGSSVGRWIRQFSGALDVRWFGTRANGGTSSPSDDAPAIQAAISAVGSAGRLLIPEGNYFVGGATGYVRQLFLVDDSIEIEGFGRGSRLLVSSALPTDVDIFRIAPSEQAGSANDGRLIRLEGFTIEAYGGTPGRHGICVDADATATPRRIVSMLTIRRLLIHGLSSHGIASRTASDGFFNSVVAQCQVDKGIYFDQCGDNIYIEENLIVGAGWGVDVTQTPLSQGLVIRQNSMVGGGGICIRRAESPLIESNQIEPGYAAPGVAHAIETIQGRKSCIVLQGGAGDDAIRNARILNNWCNVVGDSNTAIQVHSALNAVIDNNRFNLNAGSGRMIDITSSALNTYVSGTNGGVVDPFAYVDGGGLSYISDLGVGTAGVRRDLTAAMLTNSWVRYNDDNAPSLQKDRDRLVRLSGYLKNGLHTAGSSVLVLPVGFRPAVRCVFRVPCFTSNLGAVEAILQIDRYTGAVSFYADPDPGATVSELHLSGISFPVQQQTYLP